MTTFDPNMNLALMVLALPGPDRKRNLAPYYFRYSYYNPLLNEPGCVATWEVIGGRDTYQISLERTKREKLSWHCTCPDAVYRGEQKPGHRCKHVQGLQNLFAPMMRPQRGGSTAA